MFTHCPAVIYPHQRRNYAEHCSSRHEPGVRLLRRLFQAHTRRTLGPAVCELQRHRRPWDGGHFHCIRASFSLSYTIQLSLCSSSSRAQDMHWFSERCTSAGTLSRLRAITLTVDEHTSLEDWQRDVLALLAPAPLEQFHISTGPIAPDMDWIQPPMCGRRSSQGGAFSSAPGMLVCPRLSAPHRLSPAPTVLGIALD